MSQIPASSGPDIWVIRENLGVTSLRGGKVRSFSSSRLPIFGCTVPCLLPRFLGPLDTSFLKVRNEVERRKDDPAPPPPLKRQRISHFPYMGYHCANESSNLYGEPEYPDAIAYLDIYISYRVINCFPIKMQQKRKKQGTPLSITQAYSPPTFVSISSSYSPLSYFSFSSCLSGPS